MSARHHRQYLDAMGITVWQARGRPVVADLEEPETREDSATIIPTPQPATQQSEQTEPAPRQWLIWPATPPGADHSVLLEDLQALCAHASAAGKPPGTLDARPEQLPPGAAVLGIGLNPDDRGWLEQQKCLSVNLPPLAEWPQPDTKLQVWQTLRDVLW